MFQGKIDPSEGQFSLRGKFTQFSLGGRILPQKMFWVFSFFPRGRPQIQRSIAKMHSEKYRIFANRLANWPFWGFGLPQGGVYLLLS